MVVDGPGVQVKLAGDVKLNPDTGQITTIFDNLPQVPFTAFALSFAGGPKAVLNNPATCGTKALSATLTPWSGTAPKTAPASFTIDQGCALPAFAPGLKVAAASTAAGRPAGSVAMEITRPDGAEDISQVKADLPPGLAGSLKGLPIGTRVGSVAAVAGAGDAPVALNGDVFLTGPQDGGLAGFQMVLPGKVGPGRPRHGDRDGVDQAAPGRWPDGADVAAAAADRRRAGVDPVVHAHAGPARLHPQRVELRRAGRPRDADRRRRDGRDGVGAVRRDGLRRARSSRPSSRQRSARAARPRWVRSRR